MLSGGLAARGSWTSRATVDDPLKYFAVVCGRVRLTTDGIDDPIELESGDVAILNDRSWLELESCNGVEPRQEVQPEQGLSSIRLMNADPEVDDVVVGGCVDVNAAGRMLLPQALPPVAHVRASVATAGNLRSVLDSLLDEVTGDRMGSAFAVRQLGQLLLLEVLRAFIDQAVPSPGWLQALTDERLSPALRVMHAEPGRSWGLDELAHTASMSRTSFAERFRAVAGAPPLTYLHRWRMLLAQRALHDRDVRVGSLAVELGYGSESAFSTAFKREVGESPLRYRRRVRQ